MEVISISNLIPISNRKLESRNRTADNTKMTIHNIDPEFKSKEALDKKKQEISNILYQIFAKYD